jgi:hypothetical protein
MPFAKYLYENYQRTVLGRTEAQYTWWESLSSREQEPWEAYGRICSAYFVP